MLLHSAQGMSHYSEANNDEYTYSFYSSFNLHSPPDNFQGYGQIKLSNILPLGDKSGLTPLLDLIVFDRIIMAAHETIKFEVDLSMYIDVADEIIPPLKVSKIRMHVIYIPSQKLM